MLRVESKNVYFYLLRHLSKGEDGERKGHHLHLLEHEALKGLDLGMGFGYYAHNLIKFSVWYLAQIKNSTPTFLF